MLLGEGSYDLGLLGRYSGLVGDAKALCALLAALLLGHLSDKMSLT